MRFFLWILIAFSLSLAAGFYWKSRGENKGQAAETINASKETVMTSNLVGHWTFDGDNVVWNDSTTEIKDSTVNANHGNAVGLTRTSVIAGVAGQGMRFNGSSDYVNLGTSIDSTGAKTVSLWFKEMGNEDTLFFSSTGDNSDFILIEFYNGDTVSVETEDTFPSSKSRQVDGFDVGVWYHLVVTKTSGGVTGIYVNGVDKTTSGGNFSPYGGTDITYIGRHPSGGYFEGSIDDVRIYNSALTATQVADLYRASSAKEVSNANHREALTNGLVGYWTFDGRDTKWSDTSTEIKDISGNNNHGDASGLTTTSVVPGKLGQGMGFDGSGDYVDAGNAYTLLNNFSNAFSISAWVKYISTNGVAPLVSWYGDYGVHIEWDVNDVFIYNYQRYRTFSPGSLYDGKWHNLVFVIPASFDITNASAYVDGSALTVTLTVNGNIVSPTSFYIGNTTTHYFNGSLDDVRFYNRALSTTEIINLYNLGR